MVVAFSDDFTSTSLSTSWSTCWWYQRPTCSHSNGEEELYTPNNVAVSGGALHLTARRESATGPGVDGNPKSFNYTSGMVTTRDTFALSYGYVEWRAFVPAGQGMWPALWMLPSDNSWPPELDVLEVVGKDTHTGAFTWYSVDGKPHPSPTYKTFPFDLASDWHVYGVDREPSGITWYVDGKPISSTDQQLDGRPMYLVMNLAVGGVWPGAPDATTPFPNTFSIDYVRAWTH